MPIPGSTRLLYNSDGSPCTSDKDILKVCYSFYSKLYNRPVLSAEPKYNFIPGGENDRLIDKIDEELLAADLSLEELHQSLMGMKVGKACGMDRLSVAFYQTFWEDLGPLILASFQ